MNKLVTGLKKCLSLTFIFFFNKFPIKNNKIFLFSYYGSQYGCSPKYITHYILERYPPEQFDIVWAFNDPNSKTKLTGIRKVKTMSIRYFYELCTSKVVITNFRTTDLFIKRKDQYYIQTWHSSLRLKQIEKDAEATLPEHYIKMAKKDSQKCDLLLSGSRASTKIFKRSFWYNGKILECGTPRNDMLFHKNTKMREEILGDLNIPLDYKVLLYAPTFRRDNNLEVYNLDFQSIVKKIEERFGGKWIVLAKLHPHLISESNRLLKGNQVLDVTSYDDVQELLSVADVLITDYSSLMFDFSITGRPCYLYVPDLYEYVKNDRKLYFDIKELPFISAGKNDELLKKIEKFDADEYKTNLRRFLNQVGSFETGKASEQLMSHIYKVCFGQSENWRRKYEAV